MEARVVVRSTLTDRVLVPSKAVKASMGRWTVRVRVGEGEEERAVTVGASDGERTEVLAGLKPGQQVVVPDA
jgi:hypothetical protein